jgi:RNA polymerase sigma factor (sigma-70 family)
MNDSPGVVYIVEDNDAFRRSVARLIQVNGFAVEAYACAEDFLVKADISYPGCLLLDVRLPDIDGLSLQNSLKKNGCYLPIIFMTGHGDIPMSVNAMKNGAINFLSKPFKTEALLSTIQEAFETHIETMDKKRETDRFHGLISTLTPREEEVFRWVIAGQLNKQIAHELGTTEKTIKVHRSRVMKKTRVSSLAQLVRLAEKAGISPASPDITNN